MKLGYSMRNQVSARNKNMKISATFTLAILIGSLTYPQSTRAASVSPPNPLTGLGRLHGINTAGKAVGHTLGDDDSEGLIYDNGTITKIQIPNSVSVKAFGIEDNGRVVGSYHEIDPVTHAATGKTHGFLYVTGDVTNIDYPGADITFARGINNAQTIVGYYRSSDGHHHGFSYSNNSFKTIDVTGALNTYVTGISNAGDIVGHYTDATADSNGNHHEHGFVSDKNGKVTTFNASVFGVVAADTFAYGINSLGIIVGSYIDDGGQTHGYIDILNFYIPLDLPGIALAHGSFVEGISDSNLLTLFGSVAFLSSVTQ